MSLVLRLDPSALKRERNNQPEEENLDTTLELVTSVAEHTTGFPAGSEQLYCLPHIFNPSRLVPGMRQQDHRLRLAYAFNQRRLVSMTPQGMIPNRKS